MTVEEYLDYDRADPWKNEYDNGIVYAGSGADARHPLLLAGLLATLWRYVPEHCVVLGSRMKVRMENPTRILFPDGSVVCGASEVAGEGDDEMLLNPTAVFELRGVRLSHFTAIESLREYAFVSVDDYRVEHFLRDGDRWNRSVVHGLDATLRLPIIGCEVPLREIYHQVLESPF